MTKQQEQKDTLTPKRQMIIIACSLIGICSLFIVLDYLFGEKMQEYTWGKSTYERAMDAKDSGDRLVSDNLSDAHEHFVAADGFLNAEEWVIKVEDEMYNDMKQIMVDRHYSHDAFYDYLGALETTTRYKEVATNWREHYEKQAKEREERELARIASGPRMLVCTNPIFTIRRGGNQQGKN